MVEMKDKVLEDNLTSDSILLESKNSFLDSDENLVLKSENIETEEQKTYLKDLLLETNSSEESSNESFFEETITEFLSYEEKNTYDTVSEFNMKTKNETILKEMRIPEPIFIRLPEYATLQALGRIFSIVNENVIVHSLLNTPVLDNETTLFLGKENVLGRTVDVFGPVEQPFYLVRVNRERQGIDFDLLEQKILSNEDIFEVYYVSNIPNLTKFVFTETIQRRGGSDASWYYDEEPPEKMLEYSDDEEEKKSKKKIHNSLEATRERQNFGSNINQSSTERTQIDTEENTQKDLINDSNNCFELNVQFNDDIIKNSMNISNLLKTENDFLQNHELQ